ncbi:MAG: hypothetical protein QM743_14360 [Chitinophagaceae bacterium]
MKKLPILIVFFVLGFNELFAQGLTIGPCATPVNKYYIYEVNGMLFASGKKSGVMIFQNSDVKKGKQYFRHFRALRHIPFLYKEFNSLFPKLDDRYPAGTEIRKSAGENKAPDTIIYHGIILKHPVEIDGAFNFKPKDSSAAALLDSFHLVNKCAICDKKHFEFYLKK